MLHPLTDKLMEESGNKHQVELEKFRLNDLITDYLKSRAEWLKEQAYLINRELINNALELSVGERE